MEHYTARIELETRDDLPGESLAALDGYRPVVARSALGWVEVTITLPADDLRQAVTTALAVTECAMAQSVLALEVMPDAQFQRRRGTEPVPDLVSVAEVANWSGFPVNAFFRLSTEERCPR